MESTPTKNHACNQKYCQTPNSAIRTKIIARSDGNISDMLNSVEYGNTEKILSQNSELHSMRTKNCLSKYYRVPTMGTVGCYCMIGGKKFFVSIDKYVISGFSATSSLKRAKLALRKTQSRQSKRITKSSWKKNMMTPANFLERNGTSIIGARTCGMKALNCSGHERHLYHVEIQAIYLLYNYLFTKKFAKDTIEMLIGDTLEAFIEKYDIQSAKYLMADLREKISDRDKKKISCEDPKEFKKKNEEEVIVLESRTGKCIYEFLTKFMSKMFRIASIHIKISHPSGSCGICSKFMQMVVNGQNSHQRFGMQLSGAILSGIPINVHWTNERGKKLTKTFSPTAKKCVKNYKKASAPAKAKKQEIKRPSTAAAPRSRKKCCRNVDANVYTLSNTALLKHPRSAATQKKCTFTIDTDAANTVIDQGKFTNPILSPPSSPVQLYMIPEEFH
jgi:hypothetical protein